VHRIQNATLKACTSRVARRTGPDCK
jgi:hypothetical protein